MKNVIVIVFVIMKLQSNCNCIRIHLHVIGPKSVHIKQSSLPFLRFSLFKNIITIVEIRLISIKIALKLPLTSKCNVLGGCRYV